jgi:hypothetical protein
MWTNYNAYADANWPWATVHDKYTLVGADILNPKTLPALASKYSDLGDPTQTDWFDDDSNGYLKRMGLTTGKDITLGSFASLFSRAVRGKINRIFTFNPEKGTMPIWNINNKFSVSADVSLTGDKKTGVITYDKSKPYNYDDDIAFFWHNCGKRCQPRKMNSVPNWVRKTGCHTGVWCSWKNAPLWIWWRSD